MARFSDDFLNELHARCDIEQLVGSYVQLKRRGKNLVGLCPFHNEKTPSFTIYPDSGSFYCFGCGAAGEAISFIRRIENLDFVEAVKFLCDRVGMSIPANGEIDDSLAQRRKRIYELNREAARFFHRSLMAPEGKRALDYLYKRGFSQKTIVRFGIGFAPDSWNALRDHLRRQGYPYELLHEANLLNVRERNGKKSYYDSFRNRVVVPIIDVRGNVVAFGARVLDDSKPKYINTSDTPVYKKSLGVFGLNIAKNTKEDSLILVEGYMDAISLHQAGFDNAVACLGTALTGEMARLLARYTKQVILCYDSDSAGQKATQRAVEIFKSISMSVRVARLEGGKDPDEILRLYGPERFRSAISGAANDLEYALMRAAEGFELNTADGKMKYLTRACEVLASAQSAVARDVYASKLSEQLGVEKQAVLATTQRLMGSRRTKQQRQKSKEIVSSAARQASRDAAASGMSVKALKAAQRIICSMIKNPEYAPLLSGQVFEQDFPETDRPLFRLISERILNKESLESVCLGQYLSGEQMSRLAFIVKSGEGLPSSKREFEDCIEVLRQERLKKQRTDISVAQLSDEEYLKLFKKQ